MHASRNSSEFPSPIEHLQRRDLSPIKRAEPHAGELFAMSTSTATIARAPRIPLFARVNASGTTMYAWNISDGGVYLKAPGLDAREIPVGRAMSLSFELPDGGSKLEVSARVVWVDRAVRDHQGRTGLGLGMRFDELPGEYALRIRRFVESFRYRVLLLHFPFSDLAESALGDLFRIEKTRDVDSLSRALATGHVGLVIIGEAKGRGEALDALQLVARNEALVRQPPILYSAFRKGSSEVNLDEKLSSLMAAYGRISYAPMPLDRLELRSHAERAVEAFVLAFENDLLTTELGRAFERLRRENEYLSSRTRLSDRLEEIVGVSDAVCSLHAMIERIAPFGTSVVIVGETGTGKELVARALHRLSPRASRPFVAQNCAALTETLLDSELFGHARGSFTGATADRAGIFEAAEGGTVFLDEIGEMSPAMQAKLLRVLQEGEVKRVGDTHTRRIEARIVCATNRDLEQLVDEGRFREDLFYRLQSFVLRLPPLRERREDIPILALHFLDRLGKKHGRRVEGLTPDAMRGLQSHGWPGNARELEHTMERLLVLCNEGERIGAELVFEALGLGRSNEERRLPSLEERNESSLNRLLEDYERRIIIAELERAGGVIARAARALGMDRTTLSRRLRRLGIGGG